MTLPEETGFEVGVEAWGRGDYHRALREFRLLAEQGHAQAQLNLGVMYAEGQGVPQDDQEAAEWLRLAPEPGDAAAQVPTWG